MRDEIREMTFGFVLLVAALTLWPGRSTSSNLAVLLVGMAGWVVGMLAWIVIVERRRPSFLRSDRKPATGASLIWVVGLGLAFVVNELLRSTWPMRGDIFLDQSIVTNSPDGLETSITYLTHYDIPDNAARLMIAWFATFLFAQIAIWALLTAAGALRRSGAHLRT